ncbi:MULTISPECIES: L,D-transpeptidase [Rhizobium]|jgi:lipoprotein-anchoring transpeptidase ErfK/SrfK|uniref:Lipoprotein-anchoring transpeptidase ErfK/SrfK n=1 Tax=Rhizobium lusitanum TaxID=293958 RepID=A0A1C3U6P4_9HYPH|nr:MULTISPECIES: L,D-transpeptidase [Rhizobium]NKJ06768.1 lipoprotein-anchoring transpeptidase ErfK/SrfK [Rhizobium sp. SG741]NRP84608.1 putative L,D-transpeptidase ErfK/SrfK [Ensifer adhaerens]SCB11007.1 Lipoprotein-anchoring transpeptidase ErfK/SrfK [Rhizobium lusitanum]
MKPALSVVAAGVVTACLLAASNAAAFSASAPYAAPATRSDVIRVAMEPRGQVKPQFQRRLVRLATNEQPGTIIIDTNNKYLYLVEGDNRARRYGIGVGRDGFGWSGVVKVGRKAEWPGWTPPPEMRVREAKKGHKLPAFQEGGEDNPLGARAMYLYRNGNDTAFRIHGTNQPWSIGLNMSSGCIRMMNKDVTDLYDRVPIGTKVIVVGPGNKQGEVSYQDRGVDVLRTIFGG